MDVITNAIIYKPASVDRVGESRALGTLSDAGEAFDNAREPLGQVFEAEVGRRPVPRSSSTTSSPRARPVPPGRRRQRRRPGRVQRVPRAAGDGAARLGRLACRPRRAWSPSSWPATSTPTHGGPAAGPLRRRLHQRRAALRQRRVLLLVLRPVRVARPHPRQRRGARARRPAPTSGTSTPASRSPYEYSRWNYHAPTSTPRPYRSSDHDPVILGLDRRTRTTRPTTDVQILGINDFHGRSWQTARGRRAVARRAVKQLRASNPNTVFAAAGDLIGAIDVRVLHPARQADHRRPQRGRPRGVGRGQPRVRPGLRRPGQPGDGAVRRRPPTPRVAPSGSTSPPTSKSRTTAPRPAESTWIKDFGGVEVGFVGAVTEDLPSLVARRRHRRHRGDRHRRTPTNEAADELKADGCRRRRAAGPRGCGRPPRWPRRRPEHRVRPDRQRRRRRHRRDRLRSHAPGLQPRGPGARMGRPRVAR